MGDSVRWYIRKSVRIPGNWIICSTNNPSPYVEHFYVSPKNKAVSKSDATYYVNIYFPTRKAARAALKSYRTKFFGLYAKYWDKQIKRSWM